MPILKSRSKHVKVYRPSGTRYSEAKRGSLIDAVQEVFTNFAVEFKELPRQDHIIIEAVGVTGAWDVTLFEIKD